LTVPVKEKGMVNSLPGKVVQPALAVVKVPKSDAENLVGVFGEDLKEARVLFSLALQDFRRATVFIRVYF
jgi:hypothetical protein